MNNKLVVYTALFGNYDDLIDPIKKFEGCDFICFTDQNLKSNIWKIIKINKIDLSSNMMNRRYKIYPHLFLDKYDYSLYLDANILIKENPLELAKKYLIKNDIAISKHPKRSCIYDEAKRCVINKKSNFLETLNQMLFYKEQNYPVGNGLTANNIIFRKHNNKLIKNLMESWWDELTKWTQRDQLCLGYIAYSQKINILIINENAWNKNKYFEFRSHKAYLKLRVIDKILLKINFKCREAYIGNLYMLLFTYFSRRK
jgi:hypothetical protein